MAPKFLYLSGTIGALNGLLVLLSAGVTLGITLAISLTALNDNGERYTTALSNAAVFRVGEFFRTPEHQVQMASVEARRHDSGFPMEHPTANLSDTALAAMRITPGGSELKRWHDVFTTMMLTDNSTYLAGAFWFLDGSQVNVLQTTLPGEHVFAIATLRVNASNHVHATAIAYDQETKVPMPPTSIAYKIAQDRPNQATDDIRALPAVRYAWDQLLTYPNAPRWLSPRVLAMDYGLWVYVLVTHRITNTSGFVIGYASRLVGLEDVGTILNTARVTEGSVAFAVDDDGILLGASGGTLVYNTTFQTGPSAPKAPCVSTSQGTISSSRHATICRFRASEHTDARIRDVAAGGLLNHHTSSYQQKMTAGGSKFFAAIQRVPRLGLDVRVVTLVPETDILGDAGRILWIALGAAAAVVVVGAAAGAALVWLLLRPLGGIARGMAAAAKFSEGGMEDSGARSSMREIAALQDAFAAMSRELRRIRSFVPQSLLVAGDTEEDLAEAALLESSEQELHLDSASSAAHSSAVPSPSKQTSSADSKYVLDGNKSHLSASATSATSATSAESSSVIPSPTVSERTGRRGKGKGPAGHHVRISDGVRLDHVTVLSVNLRGFHAATAPGGNSGGGGGLSASKVSETVSAVLAAVDAQRGVVDSFHGDRFLVSFNAARPAANHTIRGAVAAAQVMKNLQTAAASAYALPVTCGVATGQAQVGNVGCAALKRFSIVGPVVSQAACLERLCKLYDGAECLVAQRAFADIRTAVETRTVDFVQLPFATAPCLVAAIIGEHEETHGDEWMYQLQAQASAAAHSNEAWRALAAGKLDEAKNALELALKAEDAASRHQSCADLCSLNQSDSSPLSPLSPPSPLRPPSRSRLRDVSLKTSSMHRLRNHIDATAAGTVFQPEDLGRFYREVLL